MQLDIKRCREIALSRRSKDSNLSPFPLYKPHFILEFCLNENIEHILREYD